MPNDALRVIVQALRDEAPYVLVVEPWGAEFNIAPATPAIVTFQGGPATPAISVNRGDDYVSICVEGGITDYRVTDDTGAELPGR